MYLVLQASLLRSAAGKAPAARSFFLTKRAREIDLAR